MTLKSVLKEPLKIQKKVIKSQLFRHSHFGDEIHTTTCFNTIDKLERENNSINQEFPTSCSILDSFSL